MKSERFAIHRRSVLAWSLSLLATTTLCATTAMAADDVEDEVVLAGYGGTIEQFMQNEVIPAFEKATGIKVRYVVGTALGNYSKVLASKNNPEIDVYWSNGLTHVGGKQQGLYDALDTSVVTNLVDVYDSAKDPDNIGVSSYVLATGIEYNTKVLEEAGVEPPKSWADLWKPEYKGLIALYNFNVAYSQDMLPLIAKLSGGSEDDVQPGLDKIKELKESGNVTTFVSTPAELDNMMVQGQAGITVNGSTRAFILKEGGAPIDFVYPEEGAGFFNNYFDIVKGAPHPKAAQVLVNFLISPEIQAAIAKGTVAAPINKKAVVSDELAAMMPYGEERLSSLVVIDRAKMNEHLDDWATRWNRDVEGN